MMITSVLTDIQGLEDFFGDMDFKVAGTHKGITAIQMDIKIHGLTRPIIEEAIARTREARLYIMDEVMAPVISEPQKRLSASMLRRSVRSRIDPQKIGDVVGKQGKVINKIIEETGVKIDIEDDGSVAVCGTDQADDRQGNCHHQEHRDRRRAGSDLYRQGCPHHELRCIRRAGSRTRTVWFTSPSFPTSA